MTTIVTRAGKGSALTHNEVDSNFTNLNSAKYESGNNATLGTIQGSTITATTAFSGALNGTVGATTPAAGTFTNLAYTGTLTGGTGVINIGSGQIYKDASGNVGIGTSSPANTLSIYNATTSSAFIAGDSTTALFTIRSSDDATPSFVSIRKARGNTASPTAVASSDAAGELGFAAYGGTNYRNVARMRGIVDTYTSNTNISGILTFETNAGSTATTERMRIDSSGNVGIGTTSPLQKLSVQNSGFLAIALNNTASGSWKSELGFYNGASQKWAMGTDITSSGNNNFYWYDNAAGQERMRIDSSGNVGIGTSSPTQKLQVTSTNAGGLATQLILSNASASTGTAAAIGFSPFSDGTTITGSLAVYNNGSGTYDMRFNTWNGSANVERMRINSSGNLLVGTTSDTQSSTNNGTLIVNTGTQLAVSSPSAGNNINLFKPASAAQTAFIFFWTGASVVGSIAQNGNSNVSYNTSSDYRLKDNVAPITGALEKVNQLNPVNWTWKVDGSDGQGFIAHELAEVVPDCVTGEKDAVDKDGKPVYQGVDTSFLVATLTAAIQELNAKVEALEAQLQGN